MFATTEAAKLVRSWEHFDTVVDLPRFSGEGTDWKSLPGDALPDWLRFGKVTTEGDAQYYHAAVVILFEIDTKPPQSVIYTPHGIDTTSLATVAQAKPSICTLAVLHGLHDVSLPLKQLNLGAHNGLMGQRLLKAQFWLGTHDEVKPAQGMISWLLRRKQIQRLQACLMARQRSINAIVERG